MVEQGPSGEKGHSQVELVIRLKGELEATEEGRVHLFQNLPLVHRVLDLVFRDHVGLEEDLQRIHLLVALSAHKQHLPEGPATDHAQQLEVVLRKGGRGRGGRAVGGD